MKRNYVVRKSGLCLLMLLLSLLFCRVSMAAPTVPYSANTGQPACKWSVDSNYKLTIEPATPGQTCMLSQTKGSTYAPWAENGYASYITAVEVKTGVQTSNYQQNLFAWLENCSTWDLSGLDVSQSSDLEGMFKHCTKMTNVNTLRDWTFKSGADIGALFYDCPNLTDFTALKDWPVGNVTDVVNMFSGCCTTKDKNCKIDLSGAGWKTLMESGITSLSSMLIGVYGKVWLNTDLTAIPSLGETELYVQNVTCVQLNACNSGTLKFTPRIVAVNFAGDYKNYTAVSWGDTYTITPISGAISADLVKMFVDNYDQNKGYFDDGGECTVEISVNGAYANIQSVTDNGTAIASCAGQFSCTYTLSNISASHTITANVERRKFTLTYANGATQLTQATGTLPPAVVVQYPASVTLATNGQNGVDMKCAFNAVYPYVGWTDGSNNYIDGDVLTPAADKTLYPLFSSEQYWVRYSAGTANGNPPTNEYVYWQTKTTAADNTNGMTWIEAGYTFVGWTREDCQTDQDSGCTSNSWKQEVDASGNPVIYRAGDTFLMPRHEVRLTALFSLIPYTLTYSTGRAEYGTAPKAQVRYVTDMNVIIAANEGNDPDNGSAPLQRSDASFIGWTKESPALDPDQYPDKVIYPGTNFLMPFEDVTLYPVFKFIPVPVPLPEDEIGTYGTDENGVKYYIQFHNYDLCMQYMNDDYLCRNTSTNLYNN